MDGAAESRQPGLQPGTAALEDRPIGRILVDMGKLRPRDADRVFLLSRERGLRFGEAARKLGLVRQEDIRQALSVQFDYPYLRAGQGMLAPELIAAHHPFDAQAEAFRGLRTQLMLHWLGPERKVLAVVSSDPKDGRSFVAANLAVAFAQLGEKTLLVDADLRLPRQHRIFGHGNGPRLAQALLGRGGVKAAERLPYFDNLWLLSAGAAPPNPLELLIRPELQRLLAEARQQFAVVILDTSALARGTDATVGAARADGVLVVARRDRTRMADLERLCRAVTANGTPVAGAVFNQ